MNVLDRNPGFLEKTRLTLAQTDFFSRLSEKQRDQVIEKGSTFEGYAAGETIVKAGDPSDFLFVILEGEIGIVIGEGDEAIELTRLGPGQTVGEMGVLLDEPRTASGIARVESKILKCTTEIFKKIVVAVPEASLAMMRTLAQRLKKASRPVAHRDFSKEAPVPPIEVLRLLPIIFMQRHRVAPVRAEKNILLLGHCDPVEPNFLQSVSTMLPGMKIEPVPIDPQYFNKIMQSYGGDGENIGTPGSDRGSGVVQIQDLLRRLVQEGGSDLHLAAGQVPHWRIDGEINPISGFGRFGPEEVFNLMKPIMRQESIDRFTRENDEDFAFTMDKNSRFRINLLRNHHGISAIFRHIPSTIFSLEQLGMPDILKKFCESSKGMIIVSGPGGSGKSTTLAAMINHMNQNRKAHILTVEDPIEFVQESKKALITQREVGIHTRSFSRALKAALREDPDVVFIGEMRDPETIALALEFASTGHLVLGTMHTVTAATTIDRIIDQFPLDSQDQIRSMLADTLVGICCQTLCRKIGGGRIPALEILVVDSAAANTILDKKTHQLPAVIISSQNRGSRLLNIDLVRLVEAGKISPEEAFSRASDRKDLENRLGTKSRP